MLEKIFVLSALLVTIAYEVWFTKMVIREDKKIKELDKRYNELMKGSK